MFEGIKTEPHLTMTVKLTRESSIHGITVSPTMSKAIDEALTTKRDVIVIDDATYCIVRPQHPVVEGSKNYDKYESVTIIVITGLKTFAIPKHREVDTLQDPVKSQKV